ncbi:MAG: hypothetical protein E6K95_04525 [Thaumarchaeota archaeon]|nr:MAG: hypothetical protein E6K95_04525 [Nitrososphaerota archaeon]
MTTASTTVRRHARYGPPDHYLSPPSAGICLSVFAQVERGSQVLVGVPKRHERWTSEWLLSWHFYEEEELKEALLEKRLPSTYLWEGEDPKAALRRIMNDQLHVTKFKAGEPRVLSYYSPSDWYPGNNHWDIAIVYRVGVSQPVRKLPWWKQLGFVEKSRLRASQFGWNADFVKDLGIAK